MASGSASGHVSVWDLDERRLATVMHEAHSRSVTGMAFLPQNPLLLTASSDNSVKVGEPLLWAMCLLSVLCAEAVPRDLDLSDL